ncbi:MAG: hypothetical protein PHO62_10340 [Sulfurimonas sp.]|uniref:hypothetical protein n=1 Tax=Sulfurimonas sp. TaxID=2022749 RepID=UPI00261083CA|nr:hypothetical protein [Sulfurimonas sp.]MDD5373808.1 hypothetical protein [Sulfurimonas sp.]
MLKKIKTELTYFTLILLVLAVLQHSDLLNSPLERVGLMAEKGNYLHPLLWTSVVYVVINFLRLIVKYLLHLKNRNKVK